MLSKRLKTEQIAHDQIMVGLCATCGKAVKCEYWQTVQPKANAATGGANDWWADLPYIQCVDPKCGSRVYLIKEPPSAPQE